MGLMGKSFYKTEKERIRALIKEPMLEQALQYLPHLQLTSLEQESTWAIVAINLNNLRFRESLQKKEPNSDAILTGPFVEEYFSSLYRDFCERIAFRESSSPHFVFQGQDRCDFLLWELYNLRSYPAQVLAKLGMERYERQQRERFEKMMDSKSVLLAAGEEIEVDKSGLVEEYERVGDRERVRLCEEELGKRDERIERLVEENRRLLELNHSLINQNQ